VRILQVVCTENTAELPDEWDAAAAATSTLYDICGEGGGGCGGEWSGA